MSPRKAAPRPVIDRPLTAHEIDDATTHYAQPLQREERVLATAMVFRVGAEWLALPTSFVAEVTDARRVHSLPNRRDGVQAGLVNVRGDVVVHLSLAGVLGIVERQTQADVDRRRRVAPRMLVLKDARGPIAITADDVFGVHHYDPALLRSVPSTLARATIAFSSAMLDVGGLVVGCLDGLRVMDALSAALA